MKKFFKIIGLLLLLIIAFVLIAGIFVKKEYHLERSITINAPREAVWSKISSLAEMKTWSPWIAMDPATKTSIEGVPDQVGSVFKWHSEEVGVGDQTLTKIDPMQRVESHLHFVKPFEGEAEAYIALGTAPEGSRVTWGFDTKYAYPMNTMLLFFDMDDIMGKQYDDGLARLKQTVESGQVAK